MQQKCSVPYREFLQSAACKGWRNPPGVVAGMPTAGTTTAGLAAAKSCQGLTNAVARRRCRHCCVGACSVDVLLDTGARRDCPGCYWVVWPGPVGDPG